MGTTIQPVILSGGSGSRLWPLSRELYPKQLLPLVSEFTMLQETATRLNGLARVSSPLVICNEEHRFMVAEQLRQAGFEAEKILLEPVGRNTAPALTLAALYFSEKGQDPLLFVMPADHVINDIPAFQSAVEMAARLANENYLVTFGITPDKAETGYGYIQCGDAIENMAQSTTASLIQQFVEKPDLATAEQYLQSGAYLWNSGMFMMKASIWLSAMQQYQADMLICCQESLKNGTHDQDFYRIDKQTFSNCPADSIDYAIMEKITHEAAGAKTAFKGAVVPLSAGWSDVGAWSSLWDVIAKDESGNAIKGEVWLKDTHDSLFHAEQRLVVGLGLTDTIVVETADAVLVADKNSAQDVKKAVEWLKQQSRTEHVSHRRVYRPWGTYETIDLGARYQVKRITVNPGAALSLQLHHHRAEHWIVVNGTARVTRDDETFMVSENESTYIPIGAKHRLENPGQLPLEMIEVQSGSYLGEDDIVRFEDKYGR